MKPKNFSKSEAESVDVIDTLQRTISIIEKEVAKNPTFLQKEIDTRNTNNVIADHHKEDLQCQESSANSVNGEAYHRADHRPVLF